MRIRTGTILIMALEKYFPVFTIKAAIYIQEQAAFIKPLLELLSLCNKNRGKSGIPS